MIKPTVGRVVWAKFCPDWTGDHRPFAAIVTYVWNDRMVNLAIFDPNGAVHGATSVTLLQEGDVSEGDYCCEWMPYQKGQAAKAEALEQKLTEGASASG